jgi:hypothetical protein
MRRKYGRSGQVGRRLGSTEHRHSDELAWIRLQLALDPLVADVSAIARRLDLLGVTMRLQVLRACDAILRDDRCRSKELTRVVIAKILVAGMPHSVGIIRQWLTRTAGSHTQEVHFSLFCYLDEVPRLLGRCRVTRDILLLVERYLMNVRSTAASSAWMAGDLLGDHSTPKTALSVLRRVARRARFTAGRKGAIHGLAHLLKRRGAAERRAVLATLRIVAANDRSAQVRAYAHLVLSRQIQ